MKKLYTIVALAAMTILGASCNSEWEEEQYEHYVSFRSPLDSKGVTSIYVPYSRMDKEGNYTAGGEGMSNYKLPLIVSGSLTNQQNLTVHVTHDPDTLNMLNIARYATRTDLFYKDMGSDEYTFASYPETMQIKASEDVGLMNLGFNFREIDMSEKWVLPLQIMDDPSYGYQAHPRKNYAKALLRIFPYNDFSGDYSGVLLTNKIVTTDSDGNPSEPEESITKTKVRGYVVDEQTIFTYAGMLDEDYADRKKYKIKLKFIGDTKGTVAISCDNAEEIGFEQKDVVTPYRIVSVMDEKRPYLEHRYVIISNIDYYFDYEQKAGIKTRFHVKGSMTLSRNINTQIPDDDQAIEW